MPSRNLRILVRVIILLPVAAVVYCSLTWAWFSYAFPAVTTDVGDYANRFKEWSRSGLVIHFPSKIPPQAQKVRLAAYPGFLQAGAYIQLRMQLPSSEIKAIEDDLKKKTSHIYAGGGFFDHYNEDQKNNWPTTTFHTSDDPKHTTGFPSHYTLYALTAKDHSGGAWNHGETTGAAVSSEDNEGIYWAESW